jgi:hypothetical protein
MVMASLWDVAVIASIVVGSASLGLAVGYAAGISETEGTTKRAITVLGGLAGGGGVVVWSQGQEFIGFVISGLAIGFVLGINIGIYIREKLGVGSQMM